jgi:hypothetical protein
MIPKSADAGAAAVLRGRPAGDAAPPLDGSPRTDLSRRTGRARAAESRDEFQGFQGFNDGQTVDIRVIHE